MKKKVYDSDVIQAALEMAELITRIPPDKQASISSMLMGLKLLTEMESAKEVRA